MAMCRQPFWEKFGRPDLYAEVIRKPHIPTLLRDAGMAPGDSRMSPFFIDAARRPLIHFRTRRIRIHRRTESSLPPRNKQVASRPFQKRPQRTNRQRPNWPAPRRSTLPMNTFQNYTNAVFYLVRCLAPTDNGPTPPPPPSQQAYRTQHTYNQKPFTSAFPYSKCLRGIRQVVPHHLRRIQPHNSNSLHQVRWRRCL